MRVEYAKGAQKDMARLPTALTRRIADKMDWFAEQEDPLHFAKPLEGKSGLHRFRVGDYRIIATVRSGQIIVLLVLAVKHRSEAYRD